MAVLHNPSFTLAIAIVSATMCNSQCCSSIDTLQPATFCTESNSNRSSPGQQRLSEIICMLAHILLHRPNASLPIKQWLWLIFSQCRISHTQYSIFNWASFMNELLLQAIDVDVEKTILCHKLLLLSLIRRLYEANLHELEQSFLLDCDWYHKLRNIFECSLCQIPWT